MTREKLKSILTDSGVEKISEAAITLILNDVSSEISAATKSASDAAESKYKDFKSPEDYKKLSDEFEELKGANAKQTRMSKLTEAGINKKYLDYADSKIGADEADYDKRLKQFVKENPELVGATKKQTEYTEIELGGLKGNSKKPEETDNSSWNAAFKSAIGINNNE